MQFWTAETVKGTVMAVSEPAHVYGTYNNWKCSLFPNAPHLLFFKLPSHVGAHNHVCSEIVIICGENIHENFT